MNAQPAARRTMSVSTVRETVAPCTSAISQPTVPACYKLLARGYKHDLYTLDLYGYEADEDDKNSDAEVCDVTLAGSPVSLCERFSSAELSSMTDWYIAHRAEIVKEANDEIVIAQYDGVREFYRPAL